jgi:SAM-dependent methyltransferase
MPVDGAAFWNTEFTKSPAYVDVSDHILTLEIRGLSPGSALDLGCGSGKNVVILAELGWMVTGVDWADEGIRLARGAVQERGLNARFIVADTTTWSPDRRFDLVISTFALPGKEESQRVLRSAVNALAPGGTLIVADWDRSMADVWPFEAEELATPEEIAEQLVGREVERLEVRRLEAFAKDDPRASRGTATNVAFVRGRRPME